MAGQFIAKTVSQEVVNSTVQPIYLGGTAVDGSDAPIAISSSKVANLATTTTIGGNPVASQNYANSLLASYVVTGSAVASIDFSGLDINTHKSYRVEIDWNNPTASNSALYLFINGDTTQTNYYSQGFAAISGTTGIARSNVAYFGYTNANSSSSTGGNIYKSNGYVNAYSVSNETNGSSVIISTRMLTKIATVTNITQLTFTASVANSIGVGSTVRIYRGDI